MSSCRKAVIAESSCHREFPGVALLSSLPGSEIQLILPESDLASLPAMSPSLQSSIASEKNSHRVGHHCIDGHPNDSVGTQRPGKRM